MISNITDNYFIYIHISPRNGHYHTSLFLQHLRCDENGISLTPTTFTFICTHMIWKDKHTYPLSVPINSNYTTIRRTEFFVSININRSKNNWDLNRDLDICCFLCNFIMVIVLYISGSSNLVFHSASWILPTMWHKTILVMAPKYCDTSYFLFTKVKLMSSSLTLSSILVLVVKCFIM